MTTDINNIFYFSNFPGEWREIPEYNNYFVNKEGEVLSLKKNKTTLLKRKNYRYSYVCLSKNDGGKPVLLHRILAKVFIPNPLNLPQVNHKNGIKMDNKLENLEWCTASRNIKHAYETGLKCVKKLGQSHRAKIVLDLSTGIYYGTQKEALIARGIKSSWCTSQMKKYGYSKKHNLKYV